MQPIVGRRKRALWRSRTGGQDGVARVAVAVGVAAVLVVGGALAALLPGSHPTGSGPRPTASRPHATPTPPTLVNVSTATVPWSAPLSLTVATGSLRSVTATSPSGPLAGTVSGSTWRSTGVVLPSTTYHLVAQVADSSGAVSTLTRTVTTSAADRVLHVVLSPGSGRVVGIGAPVVATFDHPVRTAAARRAVLQRLSVTAAPAVAGAWRWMSSTEAHYRGATYWPAHTAVTVKADLRGLHLPGTGTWGTDTAVNRSFTIGDAIVSTVDVSAHTMTVRRNGAVLRVLPVSTGRDKYPTKGGVHIVLLKEAVHQYNSATVGIPTASPDGYFEKLPWSVRISNGGAFVHANPATVKYQGRLNVSHGCVNLSLSDAQWFFTLAQRGDVVDVVHAAVGPLLSDAGMQDWNIPFSTWRQGNLGT